MKRKTQPRITFEKFSALVLGENQKLSEIERRLGVKPSPNDDLRSSLVHYLWHFHRASRAAINRGAVLKEELSNAAHLAANLEASASLIWQAQDPAILAFQSRFGPIWISLPESGEMHPSGVPFVHFLSEFGRAAARCADELRDKGGQEAATAFQNLAISLAEHHASKFPAKDFFSFIAPVAEILRNIKPRLDADFKIPRNDNALRRQLSRWNLVPQRPRRHRTQPPSKIA
jgi:hypothetical protein